MSKYHQYDDMELMALLSKGDNDAFSEIYRRYNRPLYLHAYRMLGNAEESQDVLQDIFTSLWSGRHTILLNTALSPYLFSAVRYRILNIMAHQKIQTRYLASLATFLEAGEYITEQQIQKNELQDLIDREIGLLPPKMREIFELSRKKGLSHQMIAEKLKISSKTVKKQVYNALFILRNKLDITYLGAILFWL